MPGILFKYSDVPSSMPRLQEILIGASTNLYEGDALAMTTNATYALNSIPVVRKVLAADKTAHYLQTATAGILGVAKYGAGSNASGVVNSNPSATAFGGIAYNFASMAQGVPQQQETGQSRIQYYEWTSANVFSCKLDATSLAATQLLRDRLAGLILTTANGVTTYTIDTGAASADQCLRIIEPDESDPLYGSVGGRVFFSPVNSFNQFLNGVPYTAQ